MVTMSCADFSIQLAEAMETYSIAYGVLFLVLVTAGFVAGRLSRNSKADV